MKKIFRHWKIFYIGCCLVYIGWVILVGGNEFDRVNGQYRSLGEQLAAEHISRTALEELGDECRRAQSLLAGGERNDCRSWPPQVVAAKTKEIQELRLRARERGTIKLVLFYAGFVIIFLLTPPILIYLFIVGIITLYKTVKIVR